MAPNHYDPKQDKDGTNTSSSNGVMPSSLRTRNRNYKRSRKTVFYPFSLKSALQWWGMLLFSLTVVVWSTIFGWVQDAQINRIHDAGTVVTAQVPDRYLLPLSIVTTSRLVIPLAGTATWVVGEPLTLQERSSGRYYLCAARQRCYQVRGQPEIETLTNWRTPQELGVSVENAGHSMPLDVQVQFFMGLFLLLLTLVMAGLMHPFGPSEEERAARAQKSGKEGTP